MTRNWDSVKQELHERGLTDPARVIAHIQQIIAELPALDGTSFQNDYTPKEHDADES